MKKRYTRRILWGLGLCAVLCLPGCREEEPKTADRFPWTLQQTAAEIIEKGGERNTLRDILFLNDIYRNFDSLSSEAPITSKAFAYDLEAVEIQPEEGRKARISRGELKLAGRNQMIAIRPDPELIQTEELSLIELDVSANRNMTLRLYLDSGEGDPDKSGPGEFVLQEYLPAVSGRKFQKVALDFRQRFGLEEKKTRRFNIRLESDGGRSMDVRIRRIRMRSYAASLSELMPARGYYRWGGAARKRLDSVFLPVGSRVTYTLLSHGDGEILMNGYVGSVGEMPVNAVIRCGDEEVVSLANVAEVTSFQSRLNPRNGVIGLTIEVTGTPGGVAILGNLSVFHPFEDRHNVVYYMIDALRADKLGIEEDLFARHFKEGAVFTKAYANASRTADSLPFLFSGRYKFTLVERSEETPYLGDNELLIAECFKSRGYTTAAFINNPWLDLSNSSQGFDQIYFCWNPLLEYTRFPSEKVYAFMKYGDMRALLEAFVEHNREKPVFIYIHAMEPHIPYETPRDTRIYSTGYDQDLLEKLYQSFHKSPPYPSLENPTEEELGAVRNLYRDAVLRGHTFFEETKNYLETSGALDEASLLILSSDHGERFYEHRSWIHGPPDVYNEVLRIPLMMAGPGINPGVYEENVQLLDIYPTLLDWMGEDIFAYFPGRSLLSIIGEALAAGTGDETGGDAGTSDLRPIYADGTGAQGQYAVFWNGLKVIVDGSAVEVYDLRKDPDKTQNRASDRRYQRYIKEARIFQAKFRREGQGKQRGLSAEEKERLKILGYIK